ncbi:MAG: hypothetical protein R3B48_04900 [Kofleriaceae bacterium]
MTRFTTSLLLVLVAGASACSSDIEDENLPDNNPGGEETSGNEDTTYDHENDGKSPWEVLAEQQAAGPMRYQSRIHGCVKVRYETVGNILTSRGVGTNGQARNLFTTGQNSMGAPVYSARIRENLVPSTAGMSRLFDIFASASTEIIANFANVDACKVGGAAVPLFDNGGATCNAEAFTCLAGTTITAAHIDICNKTIAGAKNAAGNPDQALGQRLAVAVMLAAAHTCE